MKRWICRTFQAAIRVSCYFLPWRQPTVFRGNDAMQMLAERIKSDGYRKALIVTGPTIHRLGLVDSLKRALEQADVEYRVFDQTPADPTIEAIERAAALYCQSESDCVIAFGGGSPMDCAKICAAAVNGHNATVSEMRGVFKVKGKLPPLYAIPTTSGTGSEATFSAVVTDETHRKYPISSLKLIPRAAVLCPELTVGVSPRVTANTGMDALCHAVEAYIGHCNTKQTKRDALEAIKLIFDYLPPAQQDGHDLLARENMQQAAYLAGLAFTRAFIGYIHAIAHALGGQYAVPHGLACAIAMPHVLRAYGQTAHHALAEIADHLGMGGDNELEKANALIAAIDALNERLGIPSRLEALRREDIRVLAEQAAQEGNLLYPAPKVLTSKELEMILIQMQPHDE